MTHLDFPYQLDTRGRTAQADESGYVRDLIEQVLFTSPGERVNRPEFGCGLAQLVFGPNSDELAATTRFLVQGALQRWIGELIEVEEVSVEARDMVLAVTLRYRLRRTGERVTAEFNQGGGGQ